MNKSKHVWMFHCGVCDKDKPTKGGTERQLDDGTWIGVCKDCRKDEEDEQR